LKLRIKRENQDGFIWSESRSHEREATKRPPHHSVDHHQLAGWRRREVETDTLRDQLHAASSPGRTSIKSIARRAGGCPAASDPASSAVSSPANSQEEDSAGRRRLHLVRMHTATATGVREPAGVASLFGTGLACSDFVPIPPRRD